MGTNVAELRLAAETAGADARALAQIGKRGAIGGDEAVADVLAAKDGGKGKPRRDFGGNVLDAVNGDVDGFFHQRVFEFLDENAFAADLGQGGLGDLVANS